MYFESSGDPAIGSGNDSIMLLNDTLNLDRHFGSVRFSLDQSNKL